MLILLPPSEGKTQRRRGRPLDLGSLSFPSLTPLRDDLVDALVSVCEGPEPFAALRISVNLTEDVARNTRLRTAPAAPAGDVYSGVLYDALDVTSLDPAAKRRANRSIVILSALFGAVRLTDRIPAYRLHPCVRLPGVGEVTRAWRPLLAPVLEQEAGDRLVVDCRSATYASMWNPKGELGGQRVQIAVPGASHMAKHTRGLVARHLVSHGRSPLTPVALADALSPAFEVSLKEPPRPGRPWVLYATARPLSPAP